MRSIPLPHRLQSLIGPIFLAIAALVMIVWTWGDHIDPLVDFGREIYTAWRLSAGDVLYRDIEYFNGPVSPYFNSLILRIFGPTLRVLQTANLLEWAAICVLAYRLYVALSDRLAATVALLIFILLFSFIQLNNAPIFNFVGPYAHEITQSFLAAFGIFAILQRFLNHRNDGLLAAMGGLLGLIFLMKVEVTLAAAAGLATALAMDLFAIRASAGRWLKTIAIVLGAAVVPATAAWIAFCFAMPPADAIRGILGSWKYLHDSSVTDNIFYRGLSGFDQPGINIRVMLSVLGAGLIMLAPPLGVAWWMRRAATSRESRLVASVVSAVYVALWAWNWWSNIQWEAAARPLNISLLLTLIGFAVVAIRRRRNWSARLILQVGFCVFAILMLGKLALTASIYHYGFVLTAPAMAVFTMFVVCWLPEMIGRQGRSPWVFRAAALMLLVIFCIRHLEIYVVFFRPYLTETMGTGADQFHVNFRASALNEMTAMVQQRAKPLDTLAVVPEGAMINFLTKRVNPTGELVLLPGEVSLFGEAQIVRRFQLHPPDWIISLKTDVSAFGFKGFGIDYGLRISGFIRDQYQDVTPPQWHAKYPLKLLRRSG